MKKILTLSVMLLFLLMTVSSANETYMEKQTNQPMSFDNTLYVGGSGPGNYTKIQDAIDNSSDGYTIFVYDDSSPYYENVIINTSVNLIGEDKNTTIIDGKKNRFEDVISIFADGVRIEGFTIKISGLVFKWSSGIKVTSSQNIINGNIICNNYYGIWFTNIGYSKPNDNYIFNNIIRDNRKLGITSTIGIRNVNISGNLFTNNGLYGIGLSGTINSENKIFQNTVTNHRYSGISVFGNNNTIWKNTVQNNNRTRYALIWIVGIDNIITNNNLLDGYPKALQWESGDIDEVTDRLKEKNYWDGNYWGKPLSEPKLIFGKVFLDFFPLRFLWIPWITYDENPASEPYDI